ncbi:MAG: T9SS type A sorting domain-containing protein [Saprospiraceae bacterium]|nr:T9SS type A sorting domain-containing protein [Saprospiraceae bacterium]
MTQNSIFKTKRLFSHYFFAVTAILFILINGNLTAQVQEQLSYRMYEAGHNLPYDSASPPVGIGVPTIIGDQSDNLNKIPVKKPNSKSGAKISSVNAFVPETVACNLSTYQSATIIGPGDFPYTSGSGIIVNASTNVATLNNTTYSCGGNSFSTAPTAWWIQFTNEVITLTFSVPVTNFSMVMNGSNNTEVFTFTPTTGTVSLSEYCTSAFEVIGAGNQLQCNASGTYGTIVTINNPTGSTVYTITHNGLLAGSRISLLDCYVGGPVPVVDPVSNVQACGGDMVSTIAFTGTSGAIFNWTNNNTAIGLAANGTGNIASFTASNVSSQQVATITVTPVLGAESGTPVTFTITVKPKPTLTLGTIMGPVTCGGSSGSIAFTTTNLPNGIYSLTYTGPGSPQNVIVSGNAFLLSGRTAGSYSNFSITINGCTGTVAGPVNLSDPSYTWYRDLDGDTFGNPSVTQASCTPPVGYVANSTDCDDNDPLEKPGQVWYDDTDNDGYGQTGAASITQCLRPTGYRAASELLATSGDCNDNNNTINPAAAEVCDGIDNDCDGNLDNGTLITYYRDFDGDTFGDPATTIMACTLPVGYVTNNTDCDDIDPLEKPGQVWYKDTDNDSYGQTGASTITQCLRPAGYKVVTELLASSGDCNDNNGAIYPGATEVCDGIDNNCDGTTDEGLTTRYYFDFDGDGYGEAVSFIDACAPSGLYTTTIVGDCIADDADINPGATEICDGKDNDCDGQTDEGLTTRYYFDFDGDGYGEAVSFIDACAPDGFYTATMVGDCVADDADINPGATEICDGKDNDCDGQTDEGLTTRYYFDFDADGYGEELSFIDACAPDGFYTATLVGDCVADDADINPAATEVCDGIDNDCDGSIDEGVLTTYYADVDQDGFGNPSSSTQACAQPGGYVTNNTDCDDNDPLEKPGQVWFDDTDNDGYGQTGAASITQCMRPTGYRAASELLATSGDCNDNNNTINPAATEVCDGIDNDCDGSIDEGVLTTYYADVDADGFGNPSSSTQACAQPGGYVTDNTDCDDNDPLEKPGQVWFDDTDNDGYGQTGAASITQCMRPTGYRAASELLATSGDCNDNNNTINPAATEVCDGIDNDCDGSIDEGVLTTYYADVDADGFGNPSSSTQACAQPGGYVTDNTDCDDNDPLEKPGQVWFDDTDNDGYGQTGAASITQCMRPTGYRAASELLATSGDCNDNNNTINPAATEVCDGIDNDCDGSTDEGVQTTYYTDVDQDGFGNPSSSTQACAQPGGYVTDNTDCDDNDPLEKPGQIWYDDTDNDGYGQTGAASITQCLRPVGYKATIELISTTGDCNDNNNTINPAATEVCDGIDNDCDGSTDEGVQTTYFADVDQDGFGNPSSSTQACAQPGGYVTDNTDCDDNDPLEKPGQVWYKDNDNDNYGQTGAPIITQCLRPVGYKAAIELISTTGDCNDNNNTINPAATEVCDGIDNDCDGSTDEGVQTTYFADVDQDGFGNPSSSTQACAQPGGYVTNNTDCDDNDPLEKPGQVWFDDTDNDGYGQTGAASITQCLRPTGYRAASELLATSGDCNDNNNTINPSATEVCDGIDNDCDGSTDEGVLTTYYADVDQDGFGNPSSSTQACAQPGGYVTDNTDCDDNDPLEKPGQVWYKDNDNDNYGQTGAPSITQCLRPVGYKAAIELISTTGDCNDNNNTINPAATEVCDGIDNDCDGSIDEGVLTTYYADVDADGFGNPSSSTQACAQPGGYVTDNTDCDDNDPLEKPGQVWFDDTDNDGYGQTGAASITQCLRPTGYRAASELLATSGDCNDNNNTINPAATEVCDGIDNDCDGSTDEGVQTTYYADVDADGFGNPSSSTQSCTQPGGYVTNNTDCDDNDPLEKPGQVWYKDNDNDNFGQTGAASITQCLRPVGYKAAIELISTTGDCNDNNNTINPAATEMCDLIDNNCNGEVDEIFILPCGWDAEPNGIDCSEGNIFSYNISSQVFSGISINCYYPNSYTTDQLAFAQYDLCGNGSITAQITSITGGLGWAGVTMRENNTAGAKKAQLMTNLSSFSRREFRTTTGAAAYPQQFPSQNRYWLRITRTGNQFAMYISQNGTSWSLSGMQTIVMGNCIEVGLVVTNYTANSTVTATFGNVSVTGGAPLRPAIQTGEDVFAAADFTILPNPSNGWIEIDLRSYVQRKVQMELYNLQGKLLRSTKIETGRGKEEIDLTSFANGMYLVRVRAEGLPDVTKRVVLNSNQ